MSKSARAIALAASMLLATPSASRADPITIGAFLAGIGSTIGVTSSIATTAGAIAAFNAGVAFAGFVASQAVNLLVSTAVAVAAALLNSRPMDQSSVNSRNAAGTRWHVAGKRKVGGQAVFGDFDGDGAFWYLIVHCDSELVAFDHYELDGIAVTLDGTFANATARKVTSDDFQAWAGGILGQLQQRQPFITLWTSTHTPSNPVPPAIAAFKAKFPGWTDDHKLAGTTFSVVKVDPVDDKQKGQVYKWQQGPFRLGEPGLSIVGTWSRIYDHRDGTQVRTNESTWKASSNPILIACWNRYRRFGFDQSIDDINWDLIDVEADACDVLVEDKYGDDAPTYACGVAFSEDTPNIACEQEILLTCDGIRLYDDEGKTYFKAGRWEAPTVTLSADRDIYAMESRPADDGESPVDGVVVSYTEPDLGYVVVPAAPWRNPNYYVDGQLPNYAQVTIQGVQNHNQAVRLAKAIGLRTQPAHQLAPTVGLRALKLFNERIVTLDYDEDFSGAYQIHVPVELDASLRVGLLGLVPIGPDNWTLLAGEEGDKPRRDVVDNDDTIPLLTAANVDLSTVPVAGSNGNSVRIEATFPAPPSVTYSYEFYYSADNGATWRPMSVSLTSLTASSEVINAGGTYLVHWRTVTSGGNYSDYNTPPASVSANAHLYADSTSIRADSTNFRADAG